MGRIMALDYGTKRTGIAVTDPLRLIANPLDTVHTKDLISFLETYFSKEDVDILVVGEPKRLHGEQDKIGVLIDQQVVHFKRKFKNLRVVRENEQFTSKMATQAIHMMNGGKKMRENKGVVDMVSAAIILQSFMETLD